MMTTKLIANDNFRMAVKCLKKNPNNSDLIMIFCVKNKKLPMYFHSLTSQVSQQAITAHCTQ